MRMMPGIYLIAFYTMILDERVVMGLGRDGIRILILLWQCREGSSSRR